VLYGQPISRCLPTLTRVSGSFATETGIFGHFLSLSQQFLTDVLTSCTARVDAPGRIGRLVQRDLVRGDQPGLVRGQVGDDLGNLL
jgi:hypothetical protein